MSTNSYAQNFELFGRFLELQRRFVAELARHPSLVRSWLESQPPRETEAPDSRGAAKAWRTARLSAARRRELAALLESAGAGTAATDALAAWLLAAVPVCTYLEISACARPSLLAIDPAAGACASALVGLRERLFLANYGLAKSAARHRCFQDYGDRLSAASSGLLDAIDRYVPGPRAARFGYFATYWIRYRLGRHAQKHGTLVAFPINQYRISRRIDRFLAQRHRHGQPPPAEAEIRAELKLGADACYWHERRPRMVSLHLPATPDNPTYTLEHTLRDPAPEPAAQLEAGDGAERLRARLRARLTPSARVILARCGGIDSLADAAADFLAHLREQGRAQLRPRRRAAAGLGS